MAPFGHRFRVEDAVNANIDASLGSYGHGRVEPGWLAREAVGLCREWRRGLQVVNQSQGQFVFAAAGFSIAKGAFSAHRVVTYGMHTGYGGVAEPEVGAVLFLAETRREGDVGGGFCYNILVAAIKQ